MQAPVVYLVDAVLVHDVSKPLACGMIGWFLRHPEGVFVL